MGMSCLRLKGLSFEFEAYTAIMESDLCTASMTPTLSFLNCKTKSCSEYGWCVLQIAECRTAIWSVISVWGKAWHMLAHSEICKDRTLPIVFQVYKSENNKVKWNKSRLPWPIWLWVRHDCDMMLVKPGVDVGEIESSFRVRAARSRRPRVSRGVREHAPLENF